MNAKEYLSRGINLERHVQNLTDEIEHYKCLVSKCSVTYSDVPKSTAENYRLEECTQKIIDLQNPDNVKENVYIQTATTIGMSNWQKFRYVYWPFVMSRVYSDIRSLVAISYTYVVIAESLNKEGGIGALISTLSRQAKMEYVYALLFIIITIGILQDFLLKA